jgi:hypothetical protein
MKPFYLATGRRFSAPEGRRTPKSASLKVFANIERRKDEDNVARDDGQIKIFNQSFRGSLVFEGGKEIELLGSKGSKIKSFFLGGGQINK